MATVHLVGALKDDMLTSVKNRIDAGSAGGTVKIYTGSMPISPSVAVTTQVLLGTLTFSDPCATITSNTLVFSAITPDSLADNDGTATWARIADSDGNAVIDVDVSTTTGSGSIKLNTTAVKAGGPISITAMVISLP